MWDEMNAVDFINEEFKRRIGDYPIREREDFFQQCWCELVQLKHDNPFIGLTTAITMAVSRARNVWRKHDGITPVDDVDSFNPKSC